MKISLQKSKDEEDKTKETSARYATAWLDHGADPTDKTYEYVIAVNKDEAFVQVSNILLGGIPPLLDACGGSVRPVSWAHLPVSDL